MTHISIFAALQMLGWDENASFESQRMIKAACRRIALSETIEKIQTPFLFARRLASKHRRF